jgi:hypothetical protein
MTADRSLEEFPHSLTHCCVCDRAFPEPVTNWDDYFVAIEDASFACESCAEEEGFDADE